MPPAPSSSLCTCSCSLSLHPLGSTAHPAKLQGAGATKGWRDQGMEGHMPETCPEHSLRPSGPGAIGVRHPLALCQAPPRTGCPTVFSPSPRLQPTSGCLGRLQFSTRTEWPRPLPVSHLPGRDRRTCVRTSLRQGHPGKNPQALSRSAVQRVEPRSCTHTSWTAHGGWRTRISLRVTCWEGELKPLASPPLLGTHLVSHLITWLGPPT